MFLTSELIEVEDIVILWLPHFNFIPREVFPSVVRLLFILLVDLFFFSTRLTPGSLQRHGRLATRVRPLRACVFSINFQTKTLCLR